MTVKIEKVNLSDIHELENNPRWISKDEFERLKESIKDFPEMMEVREITVDETGAILGGNQRYKALVANGETEVTVKRVIGWTDEMKRKFVIKDNHANGEWDTEILANNYDPEELKEWMGDEFPNDWAEEEKEIVEDEVPEPPEEPKAKLGDIYQLGNHRLMCGDSTKLEDVQKLMNNEKADIAFTSPPYNAGFGASLTKDNGRSKYLNDDDNKDRDGYCQFLNNYLDNADIFSEYNFMNIQMLSNNKLALFDSIYSRLDKLADILIWDKTRSQPAAAKNVLNSEFEFVFAFSDKGTRSIGTIPFHGTLKNILHIPPTRNEYAKEHNAVFPIDLPAHFVKEFAKESCLDLFGGSGSTLMACEQLGRKCYMMELDPHYVDVIIQRWENFTGEKAVKL